MARGPGPRFSIGRLMAVIAAVAFVLATGRETVRALSGSAPSALGVVGLAVLTTLFIVIPAYLVFVAVPRTLLRLLLWLMPCFRADDDDPF